jgi:hypothetical protein
MQAAGLIEEDFPRIEVPAHRQLKEEPSFPLA